MNNMEPFPATGDAIARKHVATLTHECGRGRFTLTTFAPVFNVRTVHHFYNEAGRAAFAEVARGHGLLIEAEGEGDI